MYEEGGCQAENSVKKTARGLFDPFHTFSQHLFKYVQSIDYK